MQKVVIIGAGPSGLLLAHYILQRQQYVVEIYERRPDPRLVDASQDRTFPISLQERGRKALRAIPGLEDAIAEHSVFCRGTIVYQGKDKARRIPRENAILSIDRNRLVTVLLQQLAQYSAEQIQVRFSCTCVQIDGATQTITLQPENGELFTTHYDCLVGADGARSPVRNYLAESAGLQVEQRYISDLYKSVFLNRCNPAAGLDLEADKIHSSSVDNKTRMILVPQPGDRLNGVIIFNQDDHQIENLSSSDEVLAFFQTHFPIFGQLMSPEEATAFLQRPIAQVLTVRCDRFHEGDQILLIGDSAHAVSPSIGQGCNSSLQDVLIFGQLLEQYEDDWAQALPAFSQQRLPDAHALQELSDYSFPRTKRLVAEFFLRLTLSRLLHRWFPRQVPLFLFDLILDTDLPYSEVLRLHQGWVHKVKRSLSHTP